MPRPKPADDRRKRIAKAVAASAAFLGFGLLLAPGLARREPAPEAQPEPPRAQLESRRGYAPAPLPTADSGAWRDAPAPGPGPADDAARAFDCMIVPHEVIDVGSAITGVVQEIAVERGDYVEAGQVVARLDASVEEAAVRVARARAGRTDDINASRTNLELSKKRLARARELFERDVLSLDTRQEVEAKAELAALELARAREDRRLAKLQLEQSLANLERRTILTPVSGVVIERLLSPGEVVDEETLVRIARVDPLRVEAILPADWFGRMQTGDLAEIVPEAPLDQSRDAEVAIVDPVLDGASGTFGVQLDLPNPDRGLPAGLRCQVRFTGRRAPARPEAPPSLQGLRWEPTDDAAGPAAEHVAAGPDPAGD